MSTETADITSLPSALERTDEIRRRMAGRRLAVFLDYDGTLTPIVAHPDLAVLADDMRAAVEALAARCAVAIVSGRDLDDVRGKVEIDSVYYAGSHGFDIVSPDGARSQYEEGAAFLPALDGAAAELRGPLEAIPGAWAERKRYAIAVHYRQAAEVYEPAVAAIVDRVLAAHPRLRKSGGKKVFELRPRIDWHKGKAVLRLLAELGLDTPDALPVYVGDDETDEDAFRALRDRGIGVVVRDGPRETAARYALDDTDAVRRFLELLAAELS